MTKIKPFLKLIIALFIISSCSKEKLKWADNGNTFVAEKFRLKLSDSLKILTHNGNEYTFISLPADSIIKKFEINYSEISSCANKYFKENANQQIVCSENRQSIQYYNVKDTAVFFVGFSTGNNEKPFVIFSPPLVVASLGNVRNLKSEGKMRTFITEKKQFDKGLNTTMIVKNIGKVKLISDNGKLITYDYKEIIIKRNDTYKYGEKNLVIPDAIILKSKVLTDEAGLPFAEWSVKSETGNENHQKQYYIELIKYGRKIN